MLAWFLTLKYLDKWCENIHFYSCQNLENTGSGPEFANISTIGILSAIFPYLFIYSQSLNLTFLTVVLSYSICFSIITFSCDSLVIHLPRFSFSLDYCESTWFFHCYSVLYCIDDTTYKLWPLLNLGSENFFYLHYSESCQPPGPLFSSAF